MNDPQRFEFDENGVLHLRGFDNWKEPICPKCEEPIEWCLDMFSFLTLQNGSYMLAHAECAWRPSAFDRVKRKAIAITRILNRKESISGNTS